MLNEELENFYFDDDLIIIDDCFNTNLPAEHKQNLTKLFSKLTVAPFGEIFATPFKIARLSRFTELTDCLRYSSTPKNSSKLHRDRRNT